MAKKTTLLVATALSAALAFAATATPAEAAKGKEKCYGISKAGANDCATSTTSCSGTATKDAQGDAWIYVPTGTCDKIVGSSKTAK